MKTIEEQLDAVFGKGFSMRSASQEAQFAKNDEALFRDLEALEGTDDSTMLEMVAAVRNGTQGLPHSVAFAALVGAITADATSCAVANVIAVKTLTTTLKVLLEQTAERAGAPIRPLLEATIADLVGDNAEVLHVG